MGRAGSAASALPPELAASYEEEEEDEEGPGGRDRMVEHLQVGPAAGWRLRAKGGAYFTPVWLLQRHG